MTHPITIGFFISIILHGGLFWSLLTSRLLESSPSNTPSSSHIQLTLTSPISQPPATITPPKSVKVTEDKNKQTVNPSPSLAMPLVVKKAKVKQHHQGLPISHKTKKHPKTLISPSIAPIHPSPPETVSSSSEKNNEPIINNTLMAEQIYKQQLIELIEKTKKYPKKAIRRQYQGTVTLSFIIYPNGKIEQITVLTSSGKKSLDHAAIKTIKKLSLRLSFPKDIQRQQWQMTLPLQYQLL